MITKRKNPEVKSNSRMVIFDHHPSPIYYKYGNDYHMWLDTNMAVGCVYKITGI